MRLTHCSALRTLLIVGMTASILGCGLLIGQLRGTSITPPERTNVSNPLYIDQKAAQEIVTIVVPYMHTRETYGDMEMWNLYRTAVDLVAEELGLVRGLKVVVLTTEKQKEMRLSSQSETNESLRRLGVATRSDAVLLYTRLPAPGGFDFGQIYSLIFFGGAVDTLQFMELRLVSSATGATVYKQNIEVKMTNGLGTTPESLLKARLRPAVSLLVMDLAGALGR